MTSDRRDDGQLSLDFEQVVDMWTAQSKLSSLTRDDRSRSVEPTLRLVVSNGVGRALSPNSLEVTRMLTEQARALSW